MAGREGGTLQTMTMFLGTHASRVDAKGRISIPSPFRNALREQVRPGEALMIIRPSHLHDCLECWSASAFFAFSGALDEYDPFSADHDDLATSLYADAYPLDCDREGRVSLPRSLKDHAGLEDDVSFMGLGRVFQIWNPSLAEERRRQARSRTRELGQRKRSENREKTAP